MTSEGFGVSGVCLDVAGSWLGVRNVEQAPLGYQRGFPRVFATPAEQAIRWIAPNATGRELVTLFQNKVTRTTVIDWRSGRRPMPQWAIDRIKQLLDEQQRAIPKLKAGPGKSTIGFARWRARR